MNIGTAEPYNPNINELTRPPAVPDKASAAQLKHIDEISTLLKAERAKLKDGEVEIEAVPPEDYASKPPITSGTPPAIPKEFLESVADMEAGRVVPLDVAMDTQPPLSAYGTTTAERLAKLPPILLGIPQRQEPVAPPFSNGLTPAQAELLAMLAEEAGELIQAVGKTLRHGYDSRWRAAPDAPLEGPTNRQAIEQELEDMFAVLTMMGGKAGGSISPAFHIADGSGHLSVRTAQKKKWMHHK